MYKQNNSFTTVPWMLDVKESSFYHCMSCQCYPQLPYASNTQANPHVMQHEPTTNQGAVLSKKLVLEAQRYCNIWTNFDRMVKASYEGPCRQITKN